MRDDVDRAQPAEAGEGIGHLPHRIADRIEHDWLHTGAQTAQQIADIGDPGVDKDDFARRAGGAVC